MARKSTARRHKVAVHQQRLLSKKSGGGVVVQILLKKHKETGNTEDHRCRAQTRMKDALYVPFRTGRCPAPSGAQQQAETSGVQEHTSTVHRCLVRGGPSGGTVHKNPHLNLKMRPNDLTVH